MKLNGRNIADDDVAFDVQKAVDAYEKFKETCVRTPNEDVEDDEGGSGPAFELNKAIRKRLEILEAVYPKKGWLFASKQTISQWGKGPPKQPVRRKRSVLIAVLSITGIDVSTSSSLSRRPLNLSPMVELSSLKSKKLTNDPDEIEEVTYEVELASLIFKSAEMRVMSNWFVDVDGKAKKKTRGKPPTEVGTVVYGLTEADVKIDFGETEVVDWNRRVSPDTDPFLGKANGCVMIWSATRSAWIVQPLEGSPMRLSLEGIKLCTIRGQRGAFVDVKVMAIENYIDSEFRMRDHSLQVEAITEDKLNSARNRLFSIILAHRSEDAVLAIQKHKLP